ncbi:MAG TPA: hypothetical protein VF558_05195 [Rubrobacteraceae bacterium]
MPFDQLLHEGRGYRPLFFEARVEAVGEEQLGVRGVDHHVLQVNNRILRSTNDVRDFLLVFVVPHEALGCEEGVAISYSVTDVGVIQIRFASVCSSARFSSTRPLPSPCFGRGVPRQPRE